MKDNMRIIDVSTKPATKAKRKAFISKGMERQDDQSHSDESPEQLESQAIEKICATYVRYKPFKFADKGSPHPTELVRPAALEKDGDQHPPRPLEADHLYGNALSHAQHEAVIYAMAAFRRGRGFLLGDSTGVGKGRTIIAIAFEMWFHRVDRIVIVTSSPGLVNDMRRDYVAVVSAVQNADKTAAIPRFVDGRQSKSLPESGILVVTYSYLSKDKREDELTAWLERRKTLLVLDEAHRAKHGYASIPSKSGLAVCRMQRTLPDMSVVYSSATGASNPQHMKYMFRLSPDGREDTWINIMNEITSAGYGAMEMLAGTLYNEGLYVNRSLSFEDVKCHVKALELSPSDVLIHDRCAALWRVMLKHGKRYYVGRARFEAVFHCAQSWFMTELVSSLKVPVAAKFIVQMVREGHAIIVGTQVTGEASSRRVGEKEEEEHDFVGLSEQLHHDLERFGPFAKEEKDLDEVDLDILREMLATKVDSVHTGLRLLKQQVQNLPEFAGFALKKQLEAANIRVAQLTGLNLRQSDIEAVEFQDDKFDVAIISKAFSTGRSLHADRNCANKRPRIQLTLGFPWMAEDLIQQLGRTHRSNQVCPPVNVMLVTNGASDRRKLGGVSSRLRALGAILSGHRDCLGAAQHDLPDTESHGVMAVQELVYSRLFAKEMASISATSINMNTKSFFNRLMMLPWASQVHIVDVFHKVQAELIRTVPNPPKMFEISEEFKIVGIEKPLSAVAPHIHLEITEIKRTTRNEFPSSGEAYFMYTNEKTKERRVAVITSGSQPEVCNVVYPTRKSTPLNRARLESGTHIAFLGERQESTRVVEEIWNEQLQSEIQSEYIVSGDLLPLWTNCLSKSGSIQMCRLVSPNKSAKVGVHMYPLQHLKFMKYLEAAKKKDRFREEHVEFGEICRM